MASSLGTLVVKLGLDAAEFVAGLTKAESDSQKFGARLQKGIAAGAEKAAVAVAAIGAAALGAYAAIDQLVKKAGNFKDLEEVTGASAEALASFAVSAAVAGADMGTIAAASVKLTKSLTGVDDESKAAGAALTALGIPIKDFKTLDPATQIETVAKALDGFRDGAGKTAVAVALFGKSGADLLPFLKELAAEGGRQVILTQRQIELADAYADAQARSRAQLSLYAQALATETLPAIIGFQEALKETAKAMLGLDTQNKKLAEDTGVRDFALEGARFLGYLGEGVLLVADGFRIAGATIGGALAMATSGSFAAAQGIKREVEADIARIKARKSFVDILDEQLERQRKIDIGLRLISKGNEDRNDRLAQKKAIDFSGAEKPVKGAKSGAEKISEAQRYLDSLQKQQERTLELTAVEEARIEIAKGLKGLTPEIEARIFALARELDANEELKKSLEASKKAFDEEVKAMNAAQKEQENRTKAAFDEAEAIKNANRQLSDEIEIIRGGDEARKTLELRRVQDAINIKEQALAEIQLDAARKGEAAALASQIAFLRERQQLLGTKNFAEQLAEEQKAAQDLANSLSDTFASSFEGFVNGTKSAKDAFKSFTADILAQLNRLALRKVGDALFGGNGTSGPDFFSLLAKFLGGLGGGGSAGLGSGAYTGPSFGGFANGTNFAPGGAAWVGENGPERINLPRGSQVIPNNKIRDAGSTSVTVIQNIERNADTRAHRQSALNAFSTAAAAARRR
jgi:hypothetical protein